MSHLAFAPSSDVKTPQSYAQPGSTNPAAILNNYNHVASTGEENPFTDFFGEANWNPRDMRYHGQFNTMLTLPEAYKGKNVFLGSKLVGLILYPDEDNWQLSAEHGLPLMYTDQMHFSWNKVIFDEPLLDRVPELAPTKITQSTSESESATVERWGLGFHVEHGFWKTPEGREHYYRNLQAIQLATLRTIYYAVISALLAARGKNRKFVQSIQDCVRPTVDIIRAEVDSFAVFQKSAFGMDMYIDRVQTAMMAMGKRPNTLVASQQVKVYMGGFMNNAEKKTDYQFAGNDALAARRSNYNDISTYRGMALKHPTSYKRNGWKTPIDPLMQDKMFGDYMVMYDGQPTLVYDGEADMMVELEFGEMFKHRMNNKPGGALIQGIEDDEEGAGYNTSRSSRSSSTAVKRMRKSTFTEEVRAHIAADLGKIRARVEKPEQLGEQSVREISSALLSDHLDGVCNRLGTMEGQSPEANVFLQNQFTTAVNALPSNVDKLAHALWVDEKIAEKNPAAIESAGRQLAAALGSGKSSARNDPVKMQSILNSMSKPVPDNHPTYVFRKVVVGEPGDDGGGDQKDDDDDEVVEIDSKLPFPDQQTPAQADEQATRGARAELNNIIRTTNRGKYTPRVYGGGGGDGDDASDDGRGSGSSSGKRSRESDDEYEGRHLLLMRPWIEVVTGTAIVFKGGAETGQVPIGHEQFMLGDDAATGRHTGHFTLYYAVLIYEPNNITVLDDVFVRAYKCGMNTTPYKQEDREKLLKRQFMVPATYGRPSMFVVEVDKEHAEDLLKDKFVDLVGKLRNSSEDIGQHYGNRAVGNFFHMLHNPNSDEPQALNTVCMRGHFEYKRNGKHMRSINEGHLGRNLYDGMMRDLTGGDAFLKEQNYKSIIGSDRS